ncbi:hypothetical protein LSCM4_05491 [Leishmania orientalis]|uniref:Uncharacterized protein n=1 Tax=Leishmania orientalis TaxID=2249476 RepID=A0A836HHR4_9TRYP|nr:hypothetical protein LSCM4_05491 [Leishmania orientalis]
MSDSGRSSSPTSTEERDITVVIRAPPLHNDWAAEQRPSPAQATATKCSSLSPSSLTSPTPGAAELSQHRSRHCSITRVPVHSTHASRQSNAAAEVARETVAEAVSPVDITAEVQMVADLKSELYHASRSLLQARQQARASDETCAELRRRCQDLETEKQALRLELQEVQERLQVRQAQTEEQRRDAAEAKLIVLSLTAERDELSNKVQDAWDRVAELSAVLRRQETEMQSLHTDITAAQHCKELAQQQHSHVEQQLRVVQEQLRMHEADEHARGAGRQRLLATLQSALERIAGLLSNVAYDYQRSLVHDSQVREEGAASGMFALIAEHAKAGFTDDASAKSDAGNTPQVVLFSADSHPASAPGDNTLMKTQPLRQGGSTSESARVHAEDALHSAESAVLGGLWSAEGLSPPLAAHTQDESSEVHTSTGADLTAATPPERLPLSRPSTRQALVQSRRPSMSQDGSRRAEAASQISATTALSDEASLRTALTPLLLALKHVATMLSNVRHERRRWVTEAMRFKQRYEEAQRQLEAVRHTSASQESHAEVLRGRIGALQRRVEQAEAALLECRQEEMHRRGSLAQTLKCSEDWGLIQHSAELLQVRLSELSKDLQQVQEQRQVASAVSVERMKQTACEAAAEKRYQQLEEQYCTLKQWVASAWPATSGESPQLQSSEVCARIRAPVAPSAVQSLSSHPPPPPPFSSPAGRGAVSAPLGSLSTPANVSVPVAEQSRSPPAGLRRSSTPPATAFPSRRRSGEETKSAEVSPAQKDGDVRGCGTGTPLRETASSLSAEANSKSSTLAQPRARRVSSPSASASFSTTAVEVEGRVHAYPLAADAPPKADASAVSRISLPPHRTTPPSTTYSSPLNGPSSTAVRSLTNATAYNAERMPLATPYRDGGRSWSSASAPYVAPSPAPCASSGVVISPYTREDQGCGVVDGTVDYSSMFATEVLHVIEALDRRVSGALDRALHA